MEAPLLLYVVAACGLSRPAGASDWELGRARLQGALDLPGAAAAFERACAAGHTQACGSLALQLQDGRGVPHDPQRAMVLYQQACDRGLGVACMNLGLMLDGGVWADIDAPRAAALFVRAEERYRTGCEGGDLQWCPNLGTLYELGLGVPRDLDRASAVYRAACDQGHATSCANLGLVLREQGGDAAEALALLERSCVPESPLGCGLLGQVLVKDHLDPPRGVSLLDRACTAGERDPCSVLAGVYGVGMGVPEDLALATRYDERACDLGATAACWIEAQMSVEGDPARARRFAERGCFAGDGEACGALGAWVAAGHGGPADPVRSGELFRAGCRMGSLRSCATLLDRGETLPLPADRELQVLRAMCAGGVAVACAKLPVGG